MLDQSCSDGVMGSTFADFVRKRKECNESVPSLMTNARSGGNDTCFFWRSQKARKVNAVEQYLSETSVVPHATDWHLT